MAVGFDLLGRGEVDLTAALGWAVQHSPALASALWNRLSLPGDADGLEVALEVADDQGRTDLELRTASVTVVVEAKKGWLLPGETQLLKYVGRFDSGVAGLTVTLSDSSPAWARLQLPSEVGGVPVTHLPWDGVRAAVRDAKRAVSGSAERLWLDQPGTYLSGATAVRDPSGQWVYVVSVSSAKPAEGGPHSNIDFVRTLRAYAHTFGKNWPERPPVLMGFRLNGRASSRSTESWPGRSFRPFMCGGRKFQSSRALAPTRCATSAPTSRFHTFPAPASCVRAGSGHCSTSS